MTTCCASSRQRDAAHDPLPLPLGARARRDLVPLYARFPELEAADALPFVQLVQPRSWSGPGRRCHWFVAPSGDYERDCQTGAAYAGLTFAHMGRFPRSSLIHNTLIDMIRVRGGTVDGTVVGYVEWIAAMVNADRGRFRFDGYQRQRERAA